MISSVTLLDCKEASCVKKLNLALAKDLDLLTAHAQRARGLAVNSTHVDLMTMDDDVSSSTYNLSDYTSTTSTSDEDEGEIGWEFEDEKGNVFKSIMLVVGLIF